MKRAEEVKEKKRKKKFFYAVLAVVCVYEGVKNDIKSVVLIKQMTHFRLQAL
jgi:hypothetical protein